MEGTREGARERETASEGEGGSFVRGGPQLQRLIYSYSIIKYKEEKERRKREGARGSRDKTLMTIPPQRKNDGFKI